MAQPSAVEPRKTFSVLTPILFGIWQTNPCWADGCRTSISVCTQIGLDEDLWLNLRRSNHGKHSRSLHPFSLGYGKRIHAGRMDVGPASRCVLRSDWMKTYGSTFGGRTTENILGPYTHSLWDMANESMLGGWMSDQHLGVYSRYIEKFLQGYAQAGVSVQAISCQNEVET